MEQEDFHSLRDTPKNDINSESYFPMLTFDKKKKILLTKLNINLAE